MEEYTFSEKIMGTEFDVSIIAREEQFAEREYKKILVLAKKYEEKFSRFLENSELSTLNKKKTLAVSKEFISITKTAIKMSEETDGLFNPLLQIERIGYDKSFEKIEDRNYLEKIDDDINISIEDLEIKENESKIILKPNQKLDFGGFLKGYVSEVLCKKLAEKFPGAIVNIGGDLFTTGLDENGKEFVFTIENPINKNLTIKIPLKDGAMATSGNYKRKWKIGKSTVSHIIDSSGNNPKTELVSATIISKHGYTSESFATAALCLAKDASAEFLKNKNISYLLIDSGGEILTNINI